MKNTFLILFVLLSGSVLFFLGNSKSLPIPSDLITTMAIPTTVENEDLLSKIQSYALANDIKPIDATVDKIWKAIPGYNGLVIDSKASYQSMLAGNDFDVKKLVYKEVSPQVHLENLPPSPIYKGNPEKPMVALLINVAWGDEYIPDILATLNDSNVKATFFFDGSWVKKNPDLTSMINLEGHEIGNHAYSHPDLKQRSREETIVELTKTNDVIEETLGMKPKWFAPPSGSFNQETILVANELGMKTILWTVDTVDWKKPATTEMVNRVLTGVGNGSMVLMHPTKPTSEGLKSMIDGMKDKGYQLGTVSDLMSEKRIDAFE
ncbi:polysaccharide deacetylase family protein [Sporosarcina sp. FSL K6-1508]|uniref:polysaccharide deacetylase family protein n=1 Tax=Sporosarcina sp. FSL K6-1508 TaxID=2921553 RepID=UPI0030F6B9C6